MSTVVAISLRLGANSTLRVTYICVSVTEAATDTERSRLLA